ncbi:hypothetical protein EMPG_14933 [Blastomyces silverae]|uniref:Uncharacterized protein n=1 Tax=Blastomyces silverae TaxID=2060906 RepID=A0A0H1BKD8_9EURO|nr:hypothetical protein EMPG_14933 [Blastomyces silverae]
MSPVARSQARRLLPALCRARPFWARLSRPSLLRQTQRRIPAMDSFMILSQLHLSPEVALGRMGQCPFIMRRVTMISNLLRSPCTSNG